MDDNFERRVHSAAMAGWWTVLVAVAVLWIQWLAYLLVMGARPEWVRAMWGPGISWDFVQKVWFAGTAVFKFGIWLLALIALWLTLWARQLRRFR